MRKFRKQIFLGGPGSAQSILDLYERLREAINILSNLQQPNHPKNKLQTELLKKDREYWETELKDSVEDISTALLGEKDDGRGW